MHHKATKSIRMQVEVRLEISKVISTIDYCFQKIIIYWIFGLKPENKFN